MTDLLEIFSSVTAYAPYLAGAAVAAVVIALAAAIKCVIVIAAERRVRIGSFPIQVLFMHGLSMTEGDR